MEESRRVWGGLCQKPGQGGWEVGLGGAGVGLEVFLREEASIEDDLDGGWGRGGEDLGGKRCVLNVVEGETGTVGGILGLGEVLSGSFRDGIQMPGGDAGLEDEVFVGLGDAAPVVNYR